MKLTDRRALKTSSVNCVANSIRLDAPTKASVARNADVQSPTQAYTGRKGSPATDVKLVFHTAVEAGTEAGTERGGTVGGRGRGRGIALH